MRFCLTLLTALMILPPGLGMARDHWAFQPIVRTEVPEGKHPVDHFIDSRLAEAGVDKELARTKQVDDRVNAVATTWLGLTLACAECHNHKHDPLKQDEFFKAYTVFRRRGALDPAARRDGALPDQSCPVGERWSCPGGETHRRDGGPD